MVYFRISYYELLEVSVTDGTTDSKFAIHSVDPILASDPAVFISDTLPFISSGRCLINGNLVDSAVLFK